MRRLVILLVMVGMLGAIPLSAGAAQTRENNFRAVLSAGEEVPPVAAPASAVALFKVRDGNIKFVLRGRMLSGGAWGAHIHGGLPGANGPIEVGLCGAPPGGAKFRCSGKNGKIQVSGLITPGVAASWGTTIDDLHDGMQLGALYVNVHTAAWPSGEMRGQIIPQSGAVG